MNTILIYRIDNLEVFTTKFLNLVDTSIDINDFSLNPRTTNSDYFGKFEWNKFTIYYKNIIFLQPRIVLEINGQISENLLTLKISYYNLWIFVASTIILTFFSVMMMTKLPIFYGLILLIVTIIQSIWWFTYRKKRKKIFKEQIEEIIKNAA